MNRPVAGMFQPMLASPGKEVPGGDDWVFEPKYDGIRIIALVTPDQLALLTRNGIDKFRQFPEIVQGLRELSRKRSRNLVLDGEIVALDTHGEPARFQELQGRMHLLDESAVEHRSGAAPAALVVFDILVDGDELLVDEEWHERRKRLERVMRAVPASAKQVLRLSVVAERKPDAMLKEAEEHGWEGIMAKRRDAKYEPGRRVRHWQKLKLENRQEFVIGGWTEPRATRQHFGTLLLGYYDDKGNLIYAGHSGGGFSNALLGEISKKLKKIERKQSPFSTTPKTNERAHWTEPRYVAEVKFNEWTTSGMLRQPIFLGLRDDKDPRSVVREPLSATQSSSKRAGRSAADAPDPADDPPVKPRARTRTGGKKSRASYPHAEGGHATSATVVAQLRAAPDAAQASLQIDSSTRLAITNLGKIFFPAAKVTKGELMQYYAEVSPYLLPALADRPLVLKRWPNGILADAFYQQKAPDKVPPGIRVEEVADEGIDTQRRLIGGDLATLLYLIQLGAVSTDPWHSRVQSIADADYSIVDLDPGPKATFKRVVQVARWVKEELDELGLHAVPKTSGASGIHIVLPLPPGASYELSRTLAELVARAVNEKHPKETTVKRAVSTRPQDAVYVDYLQNIRGKTVASVYSARAETHASVSTPLKWTELTNDLDPRDFTIENVPKRLKRVGDLWASGMRRPNRLPGISGDAAA
ncbi:MAG TPA: DNA ligase D [Gemmatimonadaceae bacterium]|nr:DNA ligase D [Gemmatimonadaceae bacterium]